ncbi:class III poly(R)-hydroxyalkanoic acid synthase subunit PhaC [Salinibaculum salinum]|uniref:class III poly(R)-hydroxyalkanoic acid synthase subunit PhaC n=1 Tax=Salinibaculum salinum TaxID=3131996 RepID=UPI0030EF1A40
MTPKKDGRIRSPVEFLLSTQAEFADVSAETIRRAALFDDRLEDVLSVEVGETPSEVVYSENKLELRRYESVTDTRHDVPILVVYALINQPYILDLQPDRSVIRRFLEAGHDVYLIDWNEPSRLDRRLGIQDYVDRYIDNCVDFVREASDQESINVLGYCMGGTLSAIYAARYPEKVNAMALLATGLYFDDTGGILELWGDENHYDPRALTQTYGNVPGEFLDVGFALMNPVTNYVSKYVRLFERVENEDFVRNFARMETWLSESIDVAGDVYAEFLEEIYQKNSLYKNELVVDGERVDVRNIEMPLLQIVGEYDHLVPPEASKPFNDVVGSDEVTTIEYPTGHVGLAMSTNAHRDVWPEVAEWFLDQSKQPGLAEVIAEGVEQALGVDIETDVTVGDVDEIEISVADEQDDTARAVIRQDVQSIRAFLEDTLDSDIEIEVGTSGTTVAVETDDGVEVEFVETVGEATRAEIEEAIEDTDIAATYDLEHVDGIGPTYAGRLREAGIESVGELAVSDPSTVRESAQTTINLARKLIDRARALLDAHEAVETPSQD